LSAREPAAKGFVRNSFYSGMIASEFFFHTMGCVSAVCLCLFVFLCITLCRALVLMVVQWA
jgi:hypothetical protein